MPKIKVGRPRDVETPEELSRLFEKYINSCCIFNPVTVEIDGVEVSKTDGNGEQVFEVEYIAIPDVEGFCAYIGTYREAFHHMSQRNGFFNTIKHIKTVIQAHKKQLAMKNKLNAAVWIFDAKNNHGYQENVQIAMDVSPQKRLSSSEIDEQIKAIIARNQLTQIE